MSIAAGWGVQVAAGSQPVKRAISTAVTGRGGQSNLLGKRGPSGNSVGSMDALKSPSQPRGLRNEFRLDGLIGKGNGTISR